MRAYLAPRDSERCTADRQRLRGDGGTEGARCMRRATHLGLCWQHFAQEEARQIDAEQQSNYNRDIAASLNKY